MLARKSVCRKYALLSSSVRREASRGMARSNGAKKTGNGEKSLFSPLAPPAKIPPLRLRYTIPCVRRRATADPPPRTLSANSPRRSAS